MAYMLHGFTEDDQAWDGLIDVPDVRLALLPGHGWKPCPATNIDQVAQDVVKELSPTGEDLIGYSMGGRIALHVAVDHPGRVRRLVLISSGPGWQAGQDRERRANLDGALADILDEDGIGPFVAWWEANPVLKPFRPLPQDVVARIRARRLSHDPRGLAKALRAFGSGSMRDLRPDLAKVTVPTLLICGAGDQRYGQVMADMAARLPKATLVTIPEAGHAIHREQPAALRQAIRKFLAA